MILNTLVSGLREEWVEFQQGEVSFVLFGQVLDALFYSLVYDVHLGIVIGSEVVLGLNEMCQSVSLALPNPTLQPLSLRWVFWSVGVNGLFGCFAQLVLLHKRY